jgi:outer membrane protein
MKQPFFEKLFVIKLLSILIIVVTNYAASGQTLERFREHDIIETRDGLKIELLNSRGQGENEEWEVLYYKKERNGGIKKWEKTSLLQQLKQSAKLAGKSIIDSTAISTDALKIPLPSNNKSSTDTSVAAIVTTSEPILNNKPLPNTYNLSQCYQLAIERNIGLKQAQNILESSIIDLKTSRLGLFPSLSYNLGHYFSFGKNIDPVTNSFVYQSFSGGFTGVGLQLDLFNGFNKLNTIKQSAYLLEASEYAKKRTELELLTNITLTYARLLSDKEQLRVQYNNLKNTQTQLEVVDEKIKVGKSTKYENYLFNSRYNSELSTIINLRNDSSAALQDLKQLLNVNYQTEFNIASIDTTLLFRIYNENISTADFIDIIVQKHPALKQFEMEEEVARMGERIAKSNFYPSISVGGNLSSNYNVNQTNINGSKIALPRQLNDNLGQNINVSLHIPIFSKLENKNLVKKQKINISNAQLASEDARNLIVTNTLQVINDFNSVKQKYYTDLQAYELNKLSYSLYDEKYKLGQINSMELLTARDLLNTYTSRYVQSKLQLYFQYQVIELLRRY